MNPIIELDLPQLQVETEKQILDIASNYEQFKYSNGTLGQKYHEQNDKNEQIEQVKKLYGFDYLPQHRSSPCDFKLQEEIKKQLKLPIFANMYVQVIETENSFIHTDGGHRTCSLYYLLTDNTPSVTRFYTSLASPVISTIWNPADVAEYFSYEMKPHKWHTFSHNEIHSVNNITGLRVGLIIDMTKQFHTYENLISYLHKIGVINA